jgi:hypothetical protein
MVKLANLWAWFEERFPLSQGIFVAVLFVTGIFYGQFLTSSGSLVTGLSDVVGFLACWAVFLMLRIFDEHKDYALDLHNYPDRVLQSGRITLDQLKVMGVATIVLQAGFSLLRDGGLGLVTYYWLMVFGWSLLMTVEFFVPRWLNSHMPVYGASHMLIMPLILAWVMQIGASTATLTAPAGWLALMAFFSGCSYELTRKAWGAEEERDSVASYARQFGTGGVAIAITTTLAVALIASLGMVSSIIRPLPGWGWLVPPVLAWLLLVFTVSRYAKLPTIKARKLNESMVALAMAAAYVTPLTAMIVKRGLTWTL